MRTFKKFISSTVLAVILMGTTAPRAQASDSIALEFADKFFVTRSACENVAWGHCVKYEEENKGCSCESFITMEFYKCLITYMYVCTNTTE